MTKMHDDQIAHMVARFLGWRLPKPWNPDNGISYTRPNYAHAPADHDWPTGTNLFDAIQAAAMVRYMVEGLALSASPSSSEAGPDWVMVPRDVLGSVQWNGGYDDHGRNVCPWCQSSKRSGHLADCDIGKALLAASPKPTTPGLDEAGLRNVLAHIVNAARQTIAAGDSWKFRRTDDEAIEAAVVYFHSVTTPDSGRDAVIEECALRVEHDAILASHAAMNWRKMPCRDRVDEDDYERHAKECDREKDRLKKVADSLRALKSRPTTPEDKA